MFAGDKLRRLRLGKGLTQADLAFKVGVSAASVARWETGKAAPTLAHVRILAQCLGVKSIDALIK